MNILILRLENTRKLEFCFYNFNLSKVTFPELMIIHSEENKYPLIIYSYFLETNFLCKRPKFGSFWTTSLAISIIFSNTNGKSSCWSKKICSYFLLFFYIYFIYLKNFCSRIPCVFWILLKFPRKSNIIILMQIRFNFG